MKTFDSPEDRIERIQQIRIAKSELSSEESHLMAPLMEDMNAISVMYQVFREYLEDNGLENSSGQRQRFIFCILYLYSIGTLAGGKMKVGIRDRIAEVTGCTVSLISHNCENLLFQYTHYKDFKDEVDDILRRIAERLPLGVIPASNGCHAKGYRIMMADGDSKPIESIAVGDRVMGADGTPRNVLEVHSGHGRLMRVRPVKGEPFYVNEGHILSLFSATRHKVMELTAMAYFRLPPKNKRLLLLQKDKEIVRFEVFRTRRVEDYHGFTIDGDHLYLDYQGFIHHNDGEI